jgi:hypothetical protein
MKAGTLRLWMTHYKRMPGQNELGEPSPMFTPLAEFAAGVLPINAKAGGNEFLNAAHMLIRVDRIFECRYSSVKPEDRVSVGGVMYDVLSVVDPAGSASGRWELSCKNSD